MSDERFVPIETTISGPTLADIASQAVWFQRMQIDRALRLACAHFRIDLAVDVQRSRVEHRDVQASPLHTHEVAVDGVVVWRLRYEQRENEIVSDGEWLGPMALSHAFIPAIGAELVTTKPMLVGRFTVG